MKKIISIISCVLLILGMYSCYKDKGNYDYKTLDNIVIDTSVNNIQADYAVYRYDTLTIQPEIYLNGKLVSSEKEVSGKLEFTWVIFQGYVGTPVYTRDTLSHQINLKVPITKSAGKWIVHLAVKDLNTQVETYQRFNLQVSEVLSDGWMVLYEKEGKTDVGIIVDERVKTGVTKPRQFLDVIKNTNGAALDGKPVSLVHSIAPLSSGDVLIASENDMVGVDKSSFTITYPFNKLFWTAPANKSIQFLTGNNTRKELVVNDNKVHVTNFISSGSYRTNYFGAALGGDYGQIDSWTPYYYGSAYDAVVYDKTNKRFAYVAANGVAVTRFPTQLATTQFNVDNVGLDMKANDWGLTNYEYSIMGDGTNSYLMVANFMGTTNNVGLKKIDMSTSPNVQNANTMATAFAGQYVLYGASSGVYLFKYNSGLPADLAWSAPAGETVTCVRLQKFYYPAIQLAILPNANKIVYIATWNETTKTGKVYSYFIDPSNGTIDKTSERITEGYGKIKNMSYKWNL
ncbi:PKD-like family lipoprotein [Pinibacter aurantiacus]|uniref:PKD-like family protein n=1 Tax=Pinibacter aurantiacus TaxID=2851599 RepID=A0A9E2SD00_9BACT|nr:PKD-like family lipoprotein [Pinibacter aurantiacus]MBV4358205.1 hypothetical protein [Pinibacter aurantiacus]